MTEVINLKQACVNQGNYEGYATKTVGHDNVVKIKYYPERKEVEIIFKDGQFNIYNNYNFLHGNSKVKQFIVVGAIGSDIKMVKSFNEINAADKFCRQQLEKEVNEYCEEHELGRHDRFELEYGYTEFDSYTFFNPDLDATVEYKLMEETYDEKGE